MAPEEAKSQDSDSKKGDIGFLEVLLTTFTAVFLAELGDKPHIATLLPAAQSGKPFVVFLGAASALICSSLVGVLLGRFLSNKIPPQRFEYLAGAVMVGLGLWIGIQSTQNAILNIHP